ncbi:helix-turn-helix domain-containing protein [Saccharothrix sp. BKS2]|uniref:helix-turn-helix domain-containing protein n=1 Tax=Saccharothrix sp. BKS2 TaxID=3064400 RepID=UPI0039EA9EF3
MDNSKGLGSRVAQERKLKGWTQAALAQRAHVSISLVKAVEQGRAPASSAFVSACARAFGLSVAELLGQPYPRTNKDEHDMYASVSAIRRELAAYMIEPVEDVEVRELGEISKDVARASRLRHAVSLAELGAEIPGIMAELRAAVFTSTDSARERAFGLLAEAYAAAGQVVYKLGYTDLASLTVERYEWAAARSGDELAVLAGDYQRAGELIGTADYASALRFLEKRRSTIEREVGENDAPLLSMWGSLHLKSALAAARAGNRELADDHLGEARETADRIGRDRDDYRLCFGPTNVNIWSVGLAVELNDGTEAVKRAGTFTIPRDAPRERAGHHYIDLSRGWLIHGDRAKALGSLQTAKKIAPSQTRYHPMVHETVRVIARQEARSTETLRGFAAWCGISA